MAMHQNSIAILLLRREGLLNETVVVSRVFMERLINFCYLIVSENKDPSRSDNHLKVEGKFSPELIIEFSRNYNPNKHSTSIDLREKIDTINNKVGVNKDLFFLAVSSIYADASEALNGTIYGSIFHLGMFNSEKPVKGVREIADHSRQQFSMIFFMSTLMINQMIQVLAKYENISELLHSSKKNAEGAIEIMQQTLPGNTKQTIEDPNGLWDSSEIMEASAIAVLKEELVAFEIPIRDCYEAGIQVVTLPGKRSNESDLQLAALFLKKSLVGLRSIWKLLCCGYTSPAASVAATLFEDALAATCLAGDTSNAQRFQNKKNGDLPWGAKELAQMSVRKEQLRIQGADKQFDQEEYELQWRSIYASYKWLCKIKHPTAPSAIHDAFSASADNKRYVVMAVPDLRPEDIPVKATILATSINRVRDAIRSFALALECDETDIRYQSFKKRMDTSLTDAMSAYKELMSRPLPFDLHGSQLYQEFAELKKSSTQSGGT